jgi:hypothetical protein
VIEFPRITEIPTGDVTWSAAPREAFRHDTLAELIQHGHPAVPAGSIVYVADKEHACASMFMPDVNDVIEHIADRAYEDGSEWADGYPEISEDAKSELDAFLDAWADKHMPAPTWWNCVNVREYVITQADIDSAQGATGGVS